MKRNSTIFLQIIVALVGIGALVFMLWEPHFEGRNVNSTVFEVYFKDPFLAYIYIASISFFTAIWQTLKLLGLVRKNEVFSQSAVKALQTIKYCAVTLVAFIVPPVIYLFVVRPEDDIAGGVAMGLFIILISLIVTTAAGIFERILQKAIDKTG